MLQTSGSNNAVFGIQYSVLGIRFCFFYAFTIFRFPDFTIFRFCNGPMAQWPDDPII
jgi:hypothetical protein